MTLTVDLQSQDQADYSMTFFIFGLYAWYRLDLHVNFIVFDATDLAIINFFHLSSTDDLENQSQSYLL